MVGMMGEMGPVGTPKFPPGIPSPNPAPLVENNYAWTKKTAMLFVEQPVRISKLSCNVPIQFVCSLVSFAGWRRL